MPGDHLTVSMDAKEQVTVLSLEGEVDAASAGDLDSALGKAAQREMPVILDVSNLGYIDSSGFRAIYQASEHIAISVVVSPGSVLSRTIWLAGISTKIPIFPDIGTASGCSSPGTPGS
jgi:anti-sigma B factor antagonist